MLGLQNHMKANFLVRPLIIQKAASWMSGTTTLLGIVKFMFKGRDQQGAKGK